MQYGHMTIQLYSKCSRRVQHVEQLDQLEKRSVVSDYIYCVEQRRTHMTAETRRHIRLENLSRTTLPADIERALRRQRLVGVEDGECLGPVIHVLTPVQFNHNSFVSYQRAGPTLHSLIPTFCR